MLAERKELLELVKTLEHKELERYELEKQLTSAREERVFDQKKFQDTLTSYGEVCLLTIFLRFHLEGANQFFLS